MGYPATVEQIFCYVIEVGLGVVDKGIFPSFNCHSYAKNKTIALHANRYSIAMAFFKSLYLKCFQPLMC